MRTFSPLVRSLAVLAAATPCQGAFAQFDADEEPAVRRPSAFSWSDSLCEEAKDEDDADLDPIAEVRRALKPDLAPFAERCDLEPEVAQAYRKADIADDEECPEFLGRLSANPFGTDSTANPYSPAGSAYSSKSVNNPYGKYGSPVSPSSARNPYATDAPKIVAKDGTYLGKLSDNPYDPESVANPYGRYGSPYSSASINNPYSTYGSPYSSQSPNNPYATQAPLLFGD